MQFSCTFSYGLAGDAQRIIDVVRVSIRLARRAKEAAELTIDITDVCGIEMTVDIEICRAPMSPAADCVRQLAKRIQILRAKQSDAVVERKALAGLNLGANLVQFGLVRNTHG